MRHIIAYFISLTACSTMAQNNAATYFAQVDGAMRQVQEANWQYARAATTARPLKVEKERQELLQAVGQASATIAGLSSWESTGGLRDSALSYLEIIHALLNEDFGRVTDLEPIAESSFDAMEAFLKARGDVERRLGNSAAALEREYQRFALANNLQIETHPADVENMKSVSQALDHYNTVYRIFFANYKQEAYLLDAIESADVSAIDQNRVALARSAEEGLHELKALENFPDRQLQTACRKLLAFYHEEATSDLSEAAIHVVNREDLTRQAAALGNLRGSAEYLRASMQYEETKKAFEKKDDSFRRTCASLEQRRKTLLAAWQRTADNYMGRHLN